MPYVRRNWQNAPSSATPLNAAALNNIEDGVEEAVEAVTGRLSEATLETTIGSVVEPSSRLARLRDVAVFAKARNPLDLPVMASPPTITTGTSNPDAALNTMWSFWGSVGAFRMVGATPVVYATNYARGAAVTLPTGTGNVTATQNGYRHAFETYTDAPKFSAHFTGSSTEGVHFQIDDEFATASPTPYAATSGNAYFTLDFGTRKPRRIRMWVEQAASFYRVFAHPATKFWTNPGDQPVRMAVLGDSIAARASSDNLSQQLGLLLGFEAWQIAVGGTGFVAPGTNASRFGDSTRVADLAVPSVDFIVGMTTPNDAGQAGLQAAALAAFQAWRATAPEAVIVATGMFPGSSSASANHIAAEASVFAAFNEWGDGNSYWIPVISDTAGSWVTGTGKVIGPTTGVGNADIYSQDGTHPSVAGYSYFSQRLAAGIRRKVFNIT